MVVFSLPDRAQAQGRACPRGALSFGSRVVGLPLDTFLELGMTLDGLHNEGKVRSGTQD